MAINDDTIEATEVRLTNVKPEDGGVAGGPRDVIFDSDDLVEEIKDTIGSYVKRISQGGNNYQAISGDRREFSIKLPSGKPAAIPDSDERSDTYFSELTSQEARDGKERFKSLSNSNLLDIDVAKGKSSDPSLPTGTELLEQTNSQGADSALAQDVDRILQENNRFSGANPYVDPDEPTEEEAGTKDWLPQQRFGAHAPRKWPTVLDSSEVTPVTIQNLKDMGLQVLLNASGEHRIPTDISDNKNQAKLVASVTSGPGLARIGLRVPYGRFRAGTILNSINPDFSKPTISDLENDGPTKLSYGNVNNPLAPFSSLNQGSSQITMSLLVITVSSMINALSRVINTNKTFNANILADDPNNSLRAKRLGSYYGDTQTNLGPARTRVSYRGDGSFFNLTPTRNDYVDCVQKGLEIFFEIPGGIPNLSPSTTASPQYFNVLLRTMVRDVSDSLIDGILTPAIGQNAFSRGSLEINSPGASGLSNPLSTINSAFDLITNIQNSKLIKFMDILSTIGDLSISSELSPARTESDIDSIVDNTTRYEELGTNINPSILISKNRLSADIEAKKRGNLSMASNTIMSMYTVPRGIKNAEKDVFNDDKFTSTLTLDKGFRTLDSGIRLSADDVAQFEDYLDASYMPFYFHDLRTNEIISFHAFLENLSDGFSAEYGESEGFGRTGTVYSYKNTKRSITLSFKTVSTNVDDFDEMWFKINKLIMLVYPQYTVGRKVTNAASGDTFVQPFSQLMSASPLIRLRVGDLIKTNASDLDISRLHGAGSEHFIFNSERRENTANRNQEEQTRRDNIARIEQRVADGNLQAGDIVDLKQTSYVPVAGRRSSNVIQTGTLPTPRRGRGRRRRRAEPAVVTPYGSIHQVEVISEIEDGKFNVKLVPTNNNSDSIPSLVLDFAGRAPASVIRANVAWARRTASAGTTANTQETTREQNQHDLIREFLSPEGPDGNPVFRAFRSTQGKGLPGVIKSIRFDFSEATWETEHAKAPKLMKIDIDFAPIHDINPGIADDGFMIGSIYNIGNIMKNSKGKERTIAGAADQTTNASEPAESPTDIPGR